MGAAAADIAADAEAAYVNAQDAIGDRCRAALKNDAVWADEQAAADASHTATVAADEAFTAAEEANHNLLVAGGAAEPARSMHLQRGRECAARARTAATRAAEAASLAERLAASAVVGNAAKLACDAAAAHIRTKSRRRALNTLDLDDANAVAAARAAAHARAAELKADRERRNAAQ